MERLKKINSILFTIMSSLIIVTVLILLVRIIIDMWPRSYNIPDSDIISNEQVAENLRDSLRTQIISFNQITLIDSASNIYLIPVSQKGLENPEKIPSTEMKMQILDYSYYYRGGNLYNNLIVVDLKNKTNDIIFNSRISIVDYHIFNINNHKYILMLICRNDTNKDNILDGKDLLDLYLYDFGTKKLEIISEKAEHILDLDYIDKRDQVFITIGIDRNKDNIYNRKYEPVEIQKVDISSKSITNVLGEKETEKLQRILDGLNQ